MPSRIPLPLSAAWELIWANSAEKSGVVGEAHLLLGILDAQDEKVTALLMLSGVSSEETRLYAQSWLDNGPATAQQKIEFARSASQVLLLASREAQIDKSPFIEPHHFFIGCVSHRRGAHLGQVLRPLGLDASQLRAHLRRIRASQKPYPRGHPLNDLSDSAKIVLEAAHAEMRASFCGRIAAAHLLLGLLSDAQTVDRLEQMGCDVEDLRKRAREGVKSDGEIASPQKRFSPGAQRALERAARAAKGAGRKRIDCGDLLIGLLPQGETVGEKWRGRDLDSVDGLWTVEQVAALRSILGISLIELPPAPVQAKKVLPLCQKLAIATASVILVFLHTLFFSDPSEMLRSALQNNILHVGIKLIPLLVISTCLAAVKEWLLKEKQVN